jgi:hypothetical protein
MPLNISFQPIGVLIDGHDSDGRLVLANDQLAAVIVRVDGQAHAQKNKGRWHPEAGFGKCHVRSGPLFAMPEEAGAWVTRTLTSGAA